MLLKRVKWFKHINSKSEFLRNALTLMTGTTIAQIIPIITAPIITRIYLPEYYGIMGIYMSVSGLLGIISTLSYTSAILLPEKDEDAVTVAQVCMISTLVWTFLVALLTLFLHNILASWMNAPEVSIYFLLLPVSVLSGGWGNTFTAWVSRNKQFKLSSITRVTASILTAITSISLGFIWEGPLGLMVGLLVNQIAVPLMLYYQIRKTKIKIFHFRGKEELYKMVLQYKNFPKFSLPADFINNFVNQLPIYMLGIYSGKAEIGHYNLSNRMLGLPISFISSSVSEVFKQRASSDYAKTGNCRGIFIKTFKTLLTISIIPFLLIVIFAPLVFEFIFGSEWKEAGVYTQIMAILFFLKFTVSPLSFIFYIANRQREDLVIHIYMVLSTFLCFYLGYLISGNVYYMLVFFSLNYSVIYLYYLYRSFKLTIKC